MRIGDYRSDRRNAFRSIYRRPESQNFSELWQGLGRNGREPRYGGPIIEDNPHHWPHQGKQECERRLRRLG